MNFNDISNYIKKHVNIRDAGKFINRREVPAKFVLLNEGEISNKMFLIEKGCLRSYFFKDGKDITFQFFFESEGVASAESFFENKPSRFHIETIENTVILEFQKTFYLETIEKIPEFQKMMYLGVQKRLFQYMNFMMSYIKDTPTERYLNLMKSRPEIIKRVPQHYIASYLGITPVSLSRIRNRIIRADNI